MKKNIRPLKPLIFWLIYAGVIVAAVVIDQLTKHFIEIAVANSGGCIRILGDWLTLVWTLNDGATGGIFSKLPWRHTLFFIMTLLGLPIFGYMLWRSRTRSAWGQVAFAFMIGGTVGNAIDRLFLVEKGGKFFSGAVRDFVRVENFFGIFNMADSFLVVGVILALLAIVVFDYDSLVKSLLAERKAKKQAESTPEQTVETQQTEQTQQAQQAEQQVEVTATDNAEKTDEDN